MFFSKKNHQYIDAKNAKFLLKSAKKVLNFRKDVIEESESLSINTLCRELKTAMSGKSSDRVTQICTRLTEVLTKNGGDIYPLRPVAENSEIFLVAAIVAIAFRTFFFQPFQIPTNSMFPTFHGMTSYVYDTKTLEKLSFADKIFNTIVKGASHFDVKSQASGEVIIPLYIIKNKDFSDKFCAYFELVDCRKLFVLLPSKAKMYRLIVGDVVHAINVPADFSIDDVLLKEFPGAKKWSEAFDSNQDRFNLDASGKIMWFRTGRKLEANASIIKFDILAGDMLFVDKISYNFRAPRVGESVVFRTDDIEMMHDDPKYYIKRLIGDSEDVLSIHGSGILRNGHSITGSKVFNFERERTNGYCGYVSSGLFADGGEITVEADKMFMMGDNSENSYDSRFWGCAPKKSAAGRPCFIFYPFSRFGFTK